LTNKSIPWSSCVIRNARLFNIQSDATCFLSIQQWWHEQFGTLPGRTIVVDQIETCQQLACHGIGSAILPEIALDDVDRSMNKILLRRQDGSDVTRDTWLISTEAAAALPQVQAFCDIAMR
jgi:DNA-binding transcriptional LysR family regulator